MNRRLHTATGLAAAIVLLVLATAAVARPDESRPTATPTSATTYPTGQLTTQRAPATSAPTLAASYPTPGIGLPAWGDAQWVRPDTYETIQLADLDGDGLADLFGRLSTGLEAHQFHTDIGQWIPMTILGNAPFSDPIEPKVGWQPPYYFQTIQTADLDGDGVDEVFGRGRQGLEVYRLAPGDYTDEWTWCTLADAGPFPDAEGWANDSTYWGTIQALDLDGDGVRNEVMGRSEHGVVVYRFTGTASCESNTSADVTTPQWTRVTVLPHFTDLGGWGPGGQNSTGTIQAADLDGDGQDEIFGRSTTGVVAYDYDASSWTLLPKLTAMADSPGEWGYLSQYSTIQSANFDGKPGAEIFGRAYDGIHVYRFDVESRQWNELASLTGDFRGHEGHDWGSSASYYGTIQAADINGDGKDEVLGRGATGMHVWTLTSKNTWKQMSESGPFANQYGWNNDASLWQTIQLANIDALAPLNSGGKKGPGAELVARGPTGVQTYRWNDVNNVWTSPSAVFPNYSTGALKLAYQAVNAALGTDGGVTNPTFDIRATYVSATAATLNGYIGQIQSLAYPYNIPEKAWIEVTTQLEAELTDAYHAATYFSGLEELVNAMDIDKLADDSATELSIGKHHQVGADLLIMFAGIVDAVLNLEGVGEVFSASAAVGSLISTSASSTFSFYSDGTNRHYEAAWQDVESKTSDMINQAAGGVANLQQAVAVDYGLLWAVGAMVDTRLWALPDKAPMLAEASRGYTLWVYQTILNTKSKIGTDVRKDKSYWCYTEFGDETCYKLEVTDANNADVEKKLFTPPSASCKEDAFVSDCNLGENPAYVFQALYGWEVECTVYAANCHAIGYWQPPQN
jgi:hypothetical protein